MRTYFFILTLFISATTLGQKQKTELLEVIKDSTGGFTTVLAGLKAYLEHNIKLKLIEDKYPKEISEHKYG